MPTNSRTPSDHETLPQTDRSEGVLIRADNGDVVTFDETGLTLRLSDTVVADLRERLSIALPVALDVVELLGDIDAWGLRQHGDWLQFSARLEPNQPARGYVRSVRGGDVLADAPGPIYALLSLGGPRRAGFNQGPTLFPYNILAPADDVGAVGLEGTDLASPTAGLQHLPHCSKDALIAQSLLVWRHDQMRGLPLFLVRSETDSSADLTALASGRAYANFLVALDSLLAASAALGKRPKVLAVGIDFSLEDQTGDPAAIAQGVRALMSKIERDMAQRALQRPFFLLTAEAGTQKVTAHPSILAHWELAWSHGGHAFAIPAPGYMFEQTAFGRPTDSARLRMAEMDAHAISALSQRQSWQCPMFLLAEFTGDVIRVTAQAMRDLVIDDHFGSGAGCGFTVQGTTGPVEVLSVAVASDDPRALILTCDRMPEGDHGVLCYAYGAPAPSADAYPANRGALRDDWSAPSRAAGGNLHRWALPAALPLRRGDF